jgi:hypothetical protein
MQVGPRVLYSFEESLQQACTAFYVHWQLGQNLVCMKFNTENEKLIIIHIFILQLYLCICL